MSVCECVCAGRAGTAVSSSVERRARELERTRERRRRAEGSGRGGAAFPAARRRAATMLNNLTDCEDGDGGANPGKQRSGGGKGGGGEERRQLWGWRQSGGRLIQRLGLTGAVGARGGLEPCSIGMRQALSEVLECAAPGAGLGTEGLPLPTAWEADVG